MMKNESNPLQSIVGLDLSSVEFVRDYIQLRFDGPLVTAYTLPIIEVNTETFTRDKPGYCDLLCSCISKVVVNACVYEGEQILVEFDNGIRLKISLNDKDYQNTEALIFRQNDEAWWVW
jgi:hypothetical protein